MNVPLKVLYASAAGLAVIALILGTFDFFGGEEGERSFLVDVLLPLGMLVVVVLLYRRRKRDLEGP